MTSEIMTLEEQVRILSTLTDRDHAGRHFTERDSGPDLTALEDAGLIVIHRPIHDATGINYSEKYWSLEVTPEGVDLVEVNPEYWDTTIEG